MVGAASFCILIESYVVKRRDYPGHPPKIYETAVVQPGAAIGTDAVVGAFCFVAAGAVVGSGCRIQSHTSVWAGVTLEENVFVGPAATFTNVKHPRAEWSRAPDFAKTLVKKGATLGANCTLVAPLTIDEYAFVGAGAVVTKHVPAHAIVTGNPAQITGYACFCGNPLAIIPPASTTCPVCNAKLTL